MDGTLIQNVILGLETAVDPANLIFCFFGAFLGMAIGVLPGIGPLATISMLFPITFHLEPTTALIMLAGIYYGNAYGGSATAILLNVPGSPSAAVACLDGYPMAKQGRAGIALVLTTVGSFIGGSIGIVVMMLFSPVIADIALDFGPAEYFSLMVLGLVAASTIAAGSALKGLAMVILGILLGLVGSDIYTGASRYTFGIQELYDGLSLVALSMGIFGVVEVIASVNTVQGGTVTKEGIDFKSMIPRREDWTRSWLPILRGTGIGSFLGTLPGAGALISSFIAYSVEKRISKHPEEFGKGAIEGIVSSESANNAADQTSFIPAMTLGIPGSATMALMLGVLIIHGIQPGPSFITERPDMFWGLVMSFWIGNVILIFLNIPLIGFWVKLLTVPYTILYPAILMFICIGVYSVENLTFHVWLVVILGAFGYGLRVLDFSPAPLILGFVLGPMMEENFRRAMLMSRGDFAIFVDRPISAGLIVLTVLVLIWGLATAFRQRPGVTADIPQEE
jgi:TctA family transporter